MQQKNNKHTSVKRFEDLRCWQLARELTRLVYAQTHCWKDFSLKDQIRRASVSVLSNIAEGFERGTKEEFLYFLYIAKGSSGEVRAQLYVAVDQCYLSETQFQTLTDKADYTSRMIARFIAGVKLKGHVGAKYLKPVDRQAAAFEAELQKILQKR